MAPRCGVIHIVAKPAKWMSREHADDGWHVCSPLRTGGERETACSSPLLPHQTLFQQQSHPSLVMATDGCVGPACVVHVCACRYTPKPSFWTLPLAEKREKFEVGACVLSLPPQCLSQVTCSALPLVRHLALLFHLATAMPSLYHVNHWPQSYLAWPAPTARPTLITTTVWPDCSFEVLLSSTSLRLCWGAACRAALHHHLPPRSA
jgi:hypothetical protein